MPRLRSLAAAGFILGMCALCVRLGFWQLGRLEQRRARNEIAARGLAAPPAVLTRETLADLARRPGAWAYRQAAARGRYDRSGSVLLRGRSDGGRPGVHLVTPLRMEGGVLLVNRGWVPAADGVRPAELPPADTGLVTVSGILMEVPLTRDGGGPAGGTPPASYRRLDLVALRARHGPGVLPVYLQATGDPGGLPRAVPAPVLDEGPHLGYAVQWFSFAATGLIGLAVLVWRERRRPLG